MLKPPHGVRFPVYMATICVTPRWSLLALEVSQQLPSYLASTWDHELKMSSFSDAWQPGTGSLPSTVDPQCFLTLGFVSGHDFGLYYYAQQHSSAARGANYNLLYHIPCVILKFRNVPIRIFLDNFLFPTVKCFYNIVTKVLISQCFEYS